MPISIEGGEPGKPLDINGQLSVQAMDIPDFRINRAISLGVQGNILIRTHGGLGDVICAEPAIRYAVNTFQPKATVSIDTYFPDLFSHLGVEVNDTRTKDLDFDKYLVFDSMYPGEHFHWQYLAHAYTHVVDHHSIAMWRIQLPAAKKAIVLRPSQADYAKADTLINPDKDVVIHPGRTWQSRTVPKEFWNVVVQEIIARGFRPVLVGRDTLGMTGTVRLNKDGCFDLISKLSLMETVAVLHRAKILLTNDSSTLHMAASGDAWIGFISLVKFPEFITHWRYGQFGWRMKNHSLGGVWEISNMVPATGESIRVDHVDPELLKTWLPDPKQFAEWACTQIQQ